jgi:tetratricopeptide (TPR) repeat protein
MTVAIHTHVEPWTSKQAALLALICLAAGVAGGWTIRASQRPAVAEVSQASSVPSTVPAAPQAPSAADMKQMADAQAAPQLEQLQAHPNDASLLGSLGNLYYDAQQYPTAIGYYERSLKITPADASVRTDMATAYWYTGNADAAIAQFNQSLTYAPSNPNTLFNLGLVQWKGKHDGAGAIADWEKLLAANPNYEQRDKVEEMLAEVKKSPAAVAK